MDDGAEGVHRLPLQQDVHLDQVGGLLAVGVVVQRGVATGAGLQHVEEVEDDLRHGEDVAHLDTFRGQVVHSLQGAAPTLAQLHDGADVLARADHGRLDGRLDDLGHLAAGELAGVGDDVLAAVVHPHGVDDAGRCGDQLEAELALQSFGDDLQVQQSQEAAAVAESQRGGCLRLVDQRGIVQLEPVQRVA